MDADRRAALIKRLYGCARRVVATDRPVLDPGGALNPAGGEAWFATLEEAVGILRELGTLAGDTLHFHIGPVAAAEVADACEHPGRITLAEAPAKLREMEETQRKAGGAADVPWPFQRLSEDQGPERR